MTHKLIVETEANIEEFDNTAFYVDESGNLILEGQAIFAKGHWENVQRVEQPDTSIDPVSPWVDPWLPRVWSDADRVPEGVVVADRDGDLWKWEDGRRYLNTGGEWDSGVAYGDNTWVDEFYPFTEVRENK